MVSHDRGNAARRDNLVRGWPSFPGFALAAIGLISLLAVGCGGSDSSAAQDMIPDLKDQGFQLAEQGKDPFAGPEIDTYRALYQADDGRAAMVLIYVEDNATAAQARYASLSTALEHPPAEFFGADAEQSDAESIAIGDEQRAFVTAQADQQGNLIWTDIYRSGRTIAIIQLLASGEDQQDLRRAIASAVFE